MKHEGNDFIQRLLAGDSEAAKGFFAYYSVLVKGKALAGGLSPEDAEEISQETLIRVLQRIRAKQGLDEPQKLGAFVHATARNVIALYRRDSRKHSGPSGATALEPKAEARSEESSPERQLWNGEFQQQCDRVLSSLRPRYRDFLSDYYIQCLDRKALCLKWKISALNSRVLHHRALKAFARNAEQQGVLGDLLEMMRSRPD